MSDDRTFFHFQERVLGGLLAWGTGSILAGALALASRNPVLRHVGIQAVAWGAIDATLAFFGRRGARAKIAQRAADGATQARRFRTILLANAGLDIGYIAAGLALAGKAHGRANRAGMGLGIALQGAFLLGYDSLLARLTRRWTEGAE